MGDNSQSSNLSKIQQVIDNKSSNQMMFEVKNIFEQHNNTPFTQRKGNWTSHLSVGFNNQRNKNVSETDLVCGIGTGYRIIVECKYLGDVSWVFWPDNNLDESEQKKTIIDMYGWNHKLFDESFSVQITDLFVSRYEEKRVRLFEMVRCKSGSEYVLNDKIDDERSGLSRARNQVLDSFIELKTRYTVTIPVVVVKGNKPLVYRSDSLCEEDIVIWDCRYPDKTGVIYDFSIPIIHMNYLDEFISEYENSDITKSQLLSGLVSESRR